MIKNIYFYCVLSFQVFFSLVASADINSVSALKNAVKERTLSCKIIQSKEYQPSPSEVELSVARSQRGDDEIILSAHYGDVPYVKGEDSIINGNLTVNMYNKNDLPHSRDQLEISIAELDKLTVNSDSIISGTDLYYDDWTDDTLTFMMTCKLK
jgi:hypothetical protein